MLKVFCLLVEFLRECIRDVSTRWCPQQSYQARYCRLSCSAWGTFRPLSPLVWSHLISFHHFVFVVVSTTRLLCVARSPISFPHCSETLESRVVNRDLWPLVEAFVLARGKWSVIGGWLSHGLSRALAWHLPAVHLSASIDLISASTGWCVATLSCSLLSTTCRRSLEASIVS